MRRMAEYVEIEAAKTLPGLRLVLSAGVPGPFGEAARYCFEVKKIPYLRVRQVPLASDAALLAWTAQTSAPVAVFEQERPRSSWVEIVELAERLASEPPLVPRDPETRIRMWGLCHEIAGEGGFGWQRRLMLVHGALAANADPGGVMAHLGCKYGYTPETGAAAAGRSAAILRTLSAQLLAQREAGSRYFVGDALSALDLYWAAFAIMLEPLPEADCPLPGMLRAAYVAPQPVRDAAHPLLLEHRDFVYRRHLDLPLDF
jgi:glutathione S-transferase